MARSFGVVPCFEGPSEPGAYFSEEGGYVVLGKTQLLTDFPKPKYVP